MAAGICRARLALLMAAVAAIGCAQALAQDASPPAIDPFQQRGVQAAAFGQPAADFDPLPPLNAAPPADNYPRIAQVPANVYPRPASDYPANPPGTYPPGVYPSGPPASLPAYAPPPSAGPAPSYAVPAPWQQLPPPTSVYPAEVPPVADATLQGDVPVVPGGPGSASRILDHLEGNGVVRGFYRNDQRIRWSGMEETFGAEADLTPRLRYHDGDFEFVVDTEFWINQPYERNPLEDTKERQSYASDFQIDQFAVGKLALVTNYFGWTFKIGKFDTPFGRAYYPIYTNPYLSTDNSMDEPFIRSEIIQSRETGVLAHYKSGYFVGDIALTDGGATSIRIRRRPSSRGWAWSPTIGP